MLSNLSKTMVASSVRTNLKDSFQFAKALGTPVVGAKFVEWTFQSGISLESFMDLGVIAGSAGIGAANVGLALGNWNRTSQLITKLLEADGVHDLKSISLRDGLYLATPLFSLATGVFLWSAAVTDTVADIAQFDFELGHWAGVVAGGMTFAAQALMNKISDEEPSSGS